MGLRGAVEAQERRKGEMGRVGNRVNLDVPYGVLTRGYMMGWRGGEIVPLLKFRVGG